ncbi:MAG: HD domain-containing protein [Candidatus Omnitrophica bacterium]|nr:HD domain-containing protein [Candidatus Omnitrophota bacterium]
MNIATTKSGRLSTRILSALVAAVFAINCALPAGTAYALSGQDANKSVLNLPEPGQMVYVSQGYVPSHLKGITVYPDNPLAFDFIVDTGDSKLAGKALETESNKLIKYFLAALTVPEEDIWVNLSPYEKDRIIPDEFGETEMGRDLLAQDYLLKQLTSSLMYPEDAIGRKFWNRVYKRVYEKFGTTQIPVDTFNKVWIVPEDVVVYEHDNSAFVVKSHLKVMLDQDYLAQKTEGRRQRAEDSSQNPSREGSVPGTITQQIIREIIVPEIEKEVNGGETFANLRQICNSLILASWYKQALRESLLGQIYADKNKTKGIDVSDKNINQKIYNQYLTAFKKGVYNYIKEDVDPNTQKIIPRKYFSGGFKSTLKNTLNVIKDNTVASSPILQNLVKSSLPASTPAANIHLVKTNLFENLHENQRDKIRPVALASSSARKMSGPEFPISSVLKDVGNNNSSSPVDFIDPVLIGLGVGVIGVLYWKFSNRRRSDVSGQEIRRDDSYSIPSSSLGHMEWVLKEKKEEREEDSSSSPILIQEILLTGATSFALVALLNKAIKDSNTREEIEPLVLKKLRKLLPDENVDVMRLVLPMSHVNRAKNYLKKYNDFALVYEIVSSKDLFGEDDIYDDEDNGYAIYVTVRKPNKGILEKQDGEASSPILDFDSITRDIPNNFAKAVWFVSQHPSEFYHDINHSINTALMAYLFAKARGLSEDQAVLLYHIGLLHDFDPFRAENTPARVSATLKLLEKDFSGEVSLTGQKGHSFLKEMLGWTEQEFLIARAIITRSDYPFEDSQDKTGKLVGPYSDYLEILERINKASTQTADFVLREAPLFSEYADKFNGYAIYDFKATVDMIKSWAYELTNLTEGVNVVSPEGMVKDTYGFFLTTLGKQESFHNDMLAAEFLKRPNPKLPLLEEAYQFMSPEIVERFKAISKAFAGFPEALDMHAGDFAKAEKMMTQVYEDTLKSVSSPVQGSGDTLAHIPFEDFMGYLDAWTAPENKEKILKLMILAVDHRKSAVGRSLTPDFGGDPTIRQLLIEGASLDEPITYDQIQAAIDAQESFADRQRNQDIFDKMKEYLYKAYGFDKEQSVSLKTEYQSLVTGITKNTKYATDEYFMLQLNEYLAEKLFDVEKILKDLAKRLGTTPSVVQEQLEKDKFLFRDEDGALKSRIQLLLTNSSLIDEFVSRLNKTWISLSTHPALTTAEAEKIILNSMHGGDDFTEIVINETIDLGVRTLWRHELYNILERNNIFKSVRDTLSPEILAADRSAKELWFIISTKFSTDEIFTIDDILKAFHGENDVRRLRLQRIVDNYKIETLLDFMQGRFVIQSLDPEVKAAITLLPIIADIVTRTPNATVGHALAVLKENDSDKSLQNFRENYDFEAIVKIIKRMFVEGDAGSQKMSYWKVIPSDNSPNTLASSPIKVVDQENNLLAHELSQEEFMKRWSAYVEEEGLSKYPHLLNVFSEEIQFALLDDPSLRPVFMQSLPENAMDNIEDVAETRELVQEKIGNKTLLAYMNEYSGYLAGDADVAEMVLEKGKGKVFIGATDRSTLDTLNPAHPVANGRQVYFPLPDGTWLGIKGAGTFQDKEKQRHFQYEGFVVVDEAAATLSSLEKLGEQRDDFVQFLSYRLLKKVPDGKGEVQPVENMTLDPRIIPVLIFNRVLTPHRLVKLPQLLKTDAGLVKLRKRFSRILKNQNKVKEGALITASELINMIMQKRGRAEAIKQNKELFKSTLHPQDILITGEEADNEEFMSYNTFISRSPALNKNDEMLLFNHHMSTRGIQNMIATLIKLMDVLPNSQLNLIMPDAHITFETFMKSYFSSLDTSYLILWAFHVEDGLTPSDKTMRALPALGWNYRLDLFHEETKGLDMFDMDLLNEMHAEILGWAQDALERREQVSSELTSSPVTGTQASAINNGDVGGIDLTAVRDQLQIKRDGNGVPLPLPQQPIHNMNIEGFLPVIINITPVPSIPMLLGIDVDGVDVDIDLSFNSVSDPSDFRARLVAKLD